jgi:hypothetical protein
MNNMEVPIYDGKESINKYIKKVQKFNSKILEDKYEVILEFVNEWLECKYTSLSDFRNIYEKTMLKNLKHNRDIVRKYSDIFQDKFNVDLSVGLETDSDEINDRYIIYLLIKMLNIIQYTLVKKEIGKNITYTIRKKLN